MEKRRPAPPKKRPAPPKKVAASTAVSTPAAVVTQTTAKRPTPPKKAAPIEVPKTPEITPANTPAPTPLDTPAMTQGLTEQISYNQLRDMPDKDRYTLWERLNKRTGNTFITLIKNQQLPKQLVMRLFEAQTRGILRDSKPREKKVYYCPYCTDYMKFQASSYTGYDRCIGCGISTRDYYVSADNRLFDA